MRVECGWGGRVEFWGYLGVIHSLVSALCGVPPFIHSVTCSDSCWLSTSISVSATMVKIKEGSGGKEKVSRERKGERKRRERKISKQSRNSSCRKYRNYSTRTD